jgi:hypothetical protein
MGRLMIDRYFGASFSDTGLVNRLANLQDHASLYSSYAESMAPYGTSSANNDFRNSFPCYSQKHLQIHKAEVRGELDIMKHQGQWAIAF